MWPCKSVSFRTVINVHSPRFSRLIVTLCAARKRPQTRVKKGRPGEDAGADGKRGHSAEERRSHGLDAGQGTALGSDSSRRTRSCLVGEDAALGTRARRRPRGSARRIVLGHTGKAIEIETRDHHIPGECGAVAPRRRGIGYRYLSPRCRDMIPTNPSLEKTAPYREGCTDLASETHDGVIIDGGLILVADHPS